jgi:putative transposase
MDGWLSIKAISDILEAKEDTILKGVQRGKFTKIRQQKVTGKGARGGQIWQVHITDPAIPKEHQDAWMEAKVNAAANLPAVKPKTSVAVIEKPALPAVVNLKKWQTETMDARLCIIRLIEHAAPAIGATKAIRVLVKQATEGTLPPEVQQLVPIANKRSGSADRTLSERSLMRWWSDYKKNGSNYAALAPKKVERDELPPWVPYFLKCYQVPEKISVPHALENLAAMLPPEIPMPSSSKVYRFIDKYSKLDIQKGRMTGKELKSQKGFIRRDTSMFQPLDICLCDGHSFRGYVAHPVHGRPFHPELCAVIDAVTRVVIGWSAGLAESAQTVADAVRHAVTVNDEKRYGGIMAMLYADKGAGNEATVNSDPFFGMYARLGITYKTGIPGNSQARGLIERVQNTLWIRAAKKTEFFTGVDMDDSVKRAGYLAVQKDVKQALKKGVEGKKSEKLMDWRDFLDFAQEEVELYNRRPHSSLPKITDPQTGLRRHMCPLEKWSEFMAQGWQAEVPAVAELDALFRPHVAVTTRRGEVRLWGNIYYSADLVHYNGETVIVAYDIHDANRVWVKDTEERLICIAGWNANKKEFYPVSAVEKAREDRKNRRKKLLLGHLEEVEAEAAVAVTAEVATVRELPKDVIDFEQRQQEKEREKEKARGGKRFFADCHELAEDILQRQKSGDTVGEYEARWIADYQKSASGSRRVGLYLADPDCAGRFKMQAAQ